MSDFKKLVFNDTPDVYLKMQRAETKSPYIFNPKIYVNTIHTPPKEISM